VQIGRVSLNDLQQRDGLALDLKWEQIAVVEVDER